MDKTLRLARTSLLALGMVMMLMRGAVAADSASPDDTARLLAGMPPSAQSPLAGFTRDASWQRHARTFDKAWQQLDKVQLERIRAWSGKHIPRRQPVLLLHVQRARLPLRGHVLPRCDDLRAERARAGGRHPRRRGPVERGAGRRGRTAAALAQLGAELLLLHHQEDEDRAQARAGSPARCRSSTCSSRARARPSTR